MNPHPANPMDSLDKIDPSINPADFNRALVRELIAAATACIDAIAELSIAAFESAQDPTTWARLPRPSDRCRVTGWSRSTIYRLISEGHIRAKTVNNARFYSTADVRAYIENAPEDESPQKQQP